MNGKVFLGTGQRGSWASLLGLCSPEKLQHWSFIETLKMTNSYVFLTNSLFCLIT